MTDKILNAFIASICGMIILSAVYILALFGESNSFWLMKLIGLM